MDDRKWRCHGSGAACPAMAPAADASCDNGMGMPLACPYPDGSECHCNDGHWRCDMPPEPPGAGGAPPEPPGPPGPPAGGAPEMPDGGRPDGPGHGDPEPGGRAG